jgi:hypothetical protein
MNRPELSIVIPFLNEEGVLPILRDRLEKVRNRPASWELLFVVLTRNFGHQSAVSAESLVRIREVHRDYGRRFAG